MRAFKLLAAMTAIAAMSGLSGCPGRDGAETDKRLDGAPPGHASSGNNEDGSLCGEVPAAEVYIQIGYDANGMPMVNPDRCHVNPGSRITWRGPDGDRREFEIEFKADSASEREEERIASEAGRERSKAIIVAKGELGSYAYSVKANGQELDPQIIIDPQ